MYNKVCKKYYKIKNKSDSSPTLEVGVSSLKFFDEASISYDSFEKNSAEHSATMVLNMIEIM